MEFDTLVKRRKSVRKFKSKKPDWRDIIEAVEFAIQVPLAGNLAHLKFILVDEPEKIKNLAKYSDQSFVGKTHYVMVVVSDDKDLKVHYGNFGKKYGHQQAGAAIEQFLLKLVDLGLSACWIGAFEENHVKRDLKIPKELNVEAIIPLGYSFDKATRKRKPSLDRSLRFNSYDQKVMNPNPKVEAL